MSSVITLTTAEALRFATRFPEHCTAETTRDGESCPCERRAVAIGYDPEGGAACGLYPVCAYHANANGACLALTEILRLATAE